MLHMFYRTVIPAFLILLPALPVSAASFALPSDAVIKVKEFTFPEPALHAEDQNLPALMRSHLVGALQKAGLTVDLSIPAAETEPPADGKENSPMTVDPITEDGGEKTPEAEHSTGAGEAEPPGDETPETKSPETGTAKTEGEKGYSVRAEELTQEDGGRDFAQSVFATQVLPASPSYTLTGRVTLLRENIGAPTRIGGDIRIRAEAVLHCAYQVADTAGNVLISNTASGSAARLTSNAQNIDAVMVNLNEKVVFSVADKIASTLSGVDVPPPVSSSSPDESYYQDSPGKRLKQN